MTTTLSNAGELREQGNQAFKQGHFQEAIDRYTDAINILHDQQLNETIRNDLTKCHSNRSQCYINLGQYEDAVEDATRGTKRLILLKKRIIFFVFYPTESKRSVKA
ncbi:unnamed protein product [Rotaria sp. Silwood1]|nr:unnamed protein product [Rotaria sp. Silwood1]